jgi:putative FmdB family regulatory protein
MPIYEYRCENGHVFDVMQKLSEDPLATCVECGAPVKKVLHPVGISFKGSGFYSTDYSKKGPTETSTRDTSTASNGDKGSREKKDKEKSGTSASPEKKD